VIAIVGMCALLLGLALGWFAGRHGKNDGTETVASMRLSLDGVIAEREEARIKLAQAETALNEREQSFEEQLSTLAAAKESLAGQFAEISQKLLHDAQAAFLQRANERFDQAGEKNEEKIKLLLSPVGDKLKAYEEQVDRIEKEIESLTVDNKNRSSSWRYSTSGHEGPKNINCLLMATRRPTFIPA